MSKAKELAREIKDEVVNYIASPSLMQLVDAVLSEPEPELMGFIKVTNYVGGQEIFPINTIAIFRDQGIVLNTGRVIEIRESLSELEQKIREAV